MRAGDDAKAEFRRVLRGQRACTAHGRNGCARHKAVDIAVPRLKAANVDLHRIVVGSLCGSLTLAHKVGEGFVRRDLPMNPYLARCRYARPYDHGVCFRIAACNTVEEFNRDVRVFRTACGACQGGTADKGKPFERIPACRSQTHHKIPRLRPMEQLSCWPCGRKSGQCAHGNLAFFLPCKLLSGFTAEPSSPAV